MADTRVVPIGNVKYGLKAETTFGTALSTSTAFITQPVIQAQKPVFNIQRESRLLSGRGVVRHKSDTIVERKGGTVTMPFDMIATPKTLSQHLALVGHNHSVSSNNHTETWLGSANATSTGGAVSSGLPHSVNVAWRPEASEGIHMVGAVCSDLTISGDVGANNGLISMSGNYFSGFTTASVNEANFSGTFVAAETQYFNVLEIQTRTLDVEGNDTQTFILKSFNFNFANGVNRVGFNASGDAEAYAYPEYTITGDLTIKYDSEFDYGAANNVLNDFLGGATMTLNMIVGDSAPDAAGEMEITAEIQYTGDPGLDFSENGLYHTLPFECVDDGSFACKTEVYQTDAITAW